MLGESPANCAFHLRTLAKYGFVEEAGDGRGRERPRGPRVRPAKMSDPLGTMAKSSKRASQAPRILTGRREP
jgi:hypothetical protein